MPRKARRKSSSEIHCTLDTIAFIEDWRNTLQQKYWFIDRQKNILKAS